MAITIIFLFLLGTAELMPLIGGGFAIISALIFGFHRITKTFTTIRVNARLAEKERNDDMQERIKVAVDAERQHWIDAREDESDRIARLKEIANEWKDISTQRDIRNGLLLEELVKVKAELSRLAGLYQDSLNRISALEARALAQTEG